MNLKHIGQAGVVDRAALKEEEPFVTVRHHTYSAIGFGTLA